MALQLHRLFPCGNSSTSSHLPVMLQCRTLQNYPATCLQLFPTRNGGKYNKCALLEFRKSGGTCCMMKGRLRNHRFRAERDSFLPSSFGDCRHSCAVTFQSQLHASFSFPIKYCNSCTYSRLQSNLSFKFSSQECGGRRFLSTGKASVNLSDGKIGINNIPRMLTEHFQKQAKSFVVRSIGSSRQIAVSSQQSKKSASDAITSVPKDLHLSKSDVGKKDAKLELSLSASAKSTSNSKTTRIQGTKKQIGKKKEKAVSGATVSPGDAEANGSKQASHMENLHLSKLKDGEKDIKLELSVSTSPKSSETSKKSRSQGIKKQLPNKKGKSLLGSTVSVGKAKVKVKGSKQASNVKKAIGTKNAGQSSQTYEVLAGGETPLSTIDDSPLVHEQSKKTVGKPTKTSKSQKKATVHIKSDKASSKLKSSPVVVEVTKIARKKELRSLYPPTGKSVVVVESLTKAKVIQGYLGNMFEVLPSYGHMRDLAGKSGSVCPDDDFSMVWEVPSSALTHLKSIKVALHGVENLILASDPDREGEAIAWHIYEMLQQQDALHDDINVSRVVFHEITESSIKSALQTPRDIDANLVHAYLARRALDYLIGFSISPLLWRKLPACQSAGRVQSAALAIICDRELKIDEFKPQEYWSIEVEFNKREPGSSTKNSSFPAHLTHLDLKKLEQHSIGSCEEANAIKQKMMSSSFEVLSAKTSKTRRNPPTPYITSTLQQDAANKLNFSASYTMKLAQKLYEGVKLANDEATGLITYMRTDGLHISDVAAKDIHSLVIERYGGAFASESIRKYFKKVKNAQEAHEAIRPTSIRRLPSMLTGVLDEDSLKLYSLIWSRTMACQMVPTVINQIQIDIGGAGSILGLRSTCSKVEFFGFQAVYKDTEAAAIGYNEKEEDAREEGFEVLQKLKTGDSLNLCEVEPKQHFTQPPSRYSEGSLVKKLEELGIGRPSTYASTIKVLQDRKYVTVKSRTLHPEFRGRMASAFLSQHFSELTDYSFTADMETELDNISAGMTQWKGLLKDYWTRFKESCDRAGNVDVRQVEKMLEKTFGDFLFTSLPNKSRTCPSCSTGILIFKVSRFGAGYFIGCDQHPNCKYIAKTIYGGDEKDVPQTTQFMSEPKLLGLHPTSNEKILLKSGPFGFYIQLGEDKKGSNKKKDKKGHSPKRVSVSQVKDVDAITFDQALDLLQYPLLLGNHPDDGLPVYLNMATYGFSIRHRRTVAPVQNVLDPKEVTLEEAIKLLLTKEAKQSGRFKTKPKKKEPLGAI